MRTHLSKYIGCAVIALAFILTGRLSEAAKGVNPSPFLGDAAQLLVNGGDGQAPLRYVNSNVDWNNYQNLIIDPVTYWLGQGENDGLTPRQRQDLVNYLNTQLHRQLSSQNWTLRDAPTAHTLRLAVALINTQHAPLVLAATAGEPLTETALTTARSTQSGQSVAGQIHGEMKLTQSMTGEVYAAAASRTQKDMTQSQATADAISKDWVKQIVIRLCQLQGQQNCTFMFSNDNW
jgi:hypothetical protein